ncbi:ArfGap-domain-containing protein [Punctularia strigosozonata HHB-11173 SS5]|uniref:ArfGap-domain-containing protein n=1 Tax=Punctularia strigosozonata (strain HHB-11173) TaxID=741275 RepID=UPI0004417ECA|nr:ArfGap-domain-containing protein [Punctularia strigosozonata HHB-11173 SS5]EIN10512.1 ArfGap-domain-containing protein [Punctularia strigosozonata HHB-11173 SS5]
MAEQQALKKTLNELIKREDLKNKTCVDCGNPNPQWASVSFAIFICLQCAGQHRGYGVHISFVRSVSMDTWSEEQVKRMQLGGNGPFREFMESYTPAEQGGYTQGMSAYDTYHCWAATQYREKLDAELAGKPWSPSPPTEGTMSPPGRPSSAQGLRKSRASGRAGSGLRSNSGSPAPNSPSPDQKSANESYFASLGHANAARPDNLPPSQGGRYQGFGSTPSPQPAQPPAWALSSQAAPTLSEIQQNPTAALSKGWSLFSSVVAGASKVIAENVVQPGMEKVMDPNLHQAVKGYATEASKRAAEVGSVANQWSKQQFGVDVAASVGGAVGTVRQTVAGPSHEGYSSISQDHHNESSALYQDEDDFFGEFESSGSGSHPPAQPATQQTATSTSKPIAKGEDGWDDEWKDF